MFREIGERNSLPSLGPPFPGVHEPLKRKQTSLLVEAAQHLPAGLPFSIKVEQLHRALLQETGGDVLNELSVLVPTSPTHAVQAELVTGAGSEPKD